MKRQEMKYLIYIIAVTGFLICSCSEQSGSQDKRIKITVLHSGNSTGEDGVKYREYMSDGFKCAGIDASFDHIYIDHLHYPLNYLVPNHGDEYLSRIEDYGPTLIVADGDAALQFVVADVAQIDSALNTRKYKLFHSLPVIFANAVQAEKLDLSSFTNITGFKNEIDLQRNLEVYTRITGNKNPVIELDPSDEDAGLYRQITKQAQSTASGYTITFVSDTDPYAHTDTLSVSGPAQRDTRDSQHATQDVQHIIQVKDDILNYGFIKHSGRPQFSTIRANFNTNEAIILGGYFASAETQIDDIIKYAVKILGGASPQSLPVATHKPDYYLDYNAMLRWQPSPLKYKDYSDDFTIVNVPLRVSHAFLFWLLIALAVIYVIASLSLIVYSILNYKSRNERFMTRIMQHEKMRRIMMIESQKLVYWFIKNDTIKLYKGFTDLYHLPEEMPLAEFDKYVNEDSKYSWSIITHYGDGNGKNRIRIHLDLTPQESHWYEFSFNSSHDSQETRLLMGIAYECDQEVEEDINLNKLQSDVNKSSVRQSLLSNISEDIRTPLNAVTGFSQLVLSGDTQFTKQEKEEFCKLVEENAKEIIRMIDNVLEQSQIEDGEIQIVPINTSARAFIHNVYKTHQIIVPNHLEFKEQPDSEDATVQMSPVYTMRVMDLLLSNAFKFTAKGCIEIGYKILADEGKVLFYCKDTGVGISEENCRHVFERFFKVYENDKGSGIGLYVAKTIIEKENGGIGVDSTEGKGSTFWFKLKKTNK